ncbi:hypothetical protein GRF29_28g260706 [Pseudopithomyces chartarum]|uniref:Fe2OG dioxygenase domain-containing protein n=1 Tax=Pseudopithomyces chartarum TaxID=1892770 RepID=A0AAN6M3M4_9PLEO|nr:hypothetical protein GRF29_28g260706 [Pseudopithomyces chartarum]
MIPSESPASVPPFIPAIVMTNMSESVSAEQALRIAGDDFDVHEFYPVPFPDDVPVAELEKISLSKILNGVRSECDRLFKTCTEIPQSEFFGTQTEGGALPEWLSDHHDTFKEAAECGNAMARAILSALEKPLQLPPGSLLKLHRLQDDSGDFTRILRYAGDPTNDPTRPEGFPPHKDAQTVAILFSWIGGLQIPDPKIPVEGFAVKEEDWRWVKPEPGYAVVNLGDAMEIYTNKLLRSCIHRVFKSPGLQRPHDRYSILFATRPKNDSLMKVLESPVIPPGDPTEEPITSLEWGHRIIAAVQSRARARGARDLDNI